MSDKKTYLGDGVDASMNSQGDIKLTTEDGISVTNTIVLEPAVYRNLLEWRARLNGEKRDE